MHVERDGGAKRHGINPWTARELFREDLLDEVGDLPLRGELLVLLAEALELVSKLLGAGKAIAGLFRERLLKDLIELVGNVRHNVFE